MKRESGVAILRLYWFLYILMRFESIHFVHIDVSSSLPVLINPVLVILSKFLFTQVLYNKQNEIS